MQEAPINILFETGQYIQIYLMTLTLVTNVQRNDLVVLPILSKLWQVQYAT